MKVSFDAFDRAVEPRLFLCNPDNKRLGVIARHSDFKLELNFSELSSLHLRVYKYCKRTDQLKRADCYSYLAPHRQIEVQDLGYFVIDSVEEEDDGKDPYIDVTAKSCECELSNKQFSLAAGTYPFFDVVEPEKTVFGKLMQLLPSWSQGSLPDSIKAKHRTFDDIYQDAYSFAMDDMAQAYGCLFQFDIQNRIVHVVDCDMEMESTGIFLSHQNLLANCNVTQDAESILTALCVSGDEDISIRDVNPIGGDVIYNFRYYKNTAWMSQRLINAITKWERKVISSRLSFQNYFLTWQNNNMDLVTMNSALTDLQSELTKLEKVSAEYASNPEEYQKVQKQIEEKKKEIEEKQKEIETLKQENEQVYQKVHDIQQSCSLASNFADDLFLELERFVFQGSYQDPNIVITQSMTYEEKQQQIKELYSKASKHLNTVSQPKIEFDLDCASFYFQKEFEPTREKLALGRLIHVRKDDEIISLMLLGLTIDWDGKKTSLTIGNRYQYGDRLSNYQNLCGTVSSTSNAVSINKYKWSKPVQSGTFAWINEFLGQSLKLTKKSILSSDNEEMRLDSSGLLLRRYSDEDNQIIDSRQMKLTSNGIVMTDDGWRTIKTAFGRIQLPNGTETYGINADMINAGTINADLINAGTINADLITSGSLKTSLLQEGQIVSRANTNVYFDLDRGVLSSSKLVSADPSDPNKIQACIRNTSISRTGTNLNHSHGLNLLYGADPCCFAAFCLADSVSSASKGLDVNTPGDFSIRSNTTENSGAQNLLRLTADKDLQGSIALYRRTDSASELVLEANKDVCAITKAAQDANANTVKTSVEVYKDAVKIRIAGTELVHVDSSKVDISGTLSVFGVEVVADSRGKTAITPSKLQALSEIQKLKFYSYQLSSDQPESFCLERPVNIGILLDETPLEIQRDTRNGQRTVDLYGFLSLTAKAVQELKVQTDQEVQQLANRFNQLEQIVRSKTDNEPG